MITNLYSLSQYRHLVAMKQTKDIRVSLGIGESNVVMAFQLLMLFVSDQFDSSDGFSPNVGQMVVVI